MTTAKAISFWEAVQDQYPHEAVQTHIINLKANKVEWFRNFGLADIAIARQCRIGRIGFDDTKYQESKRFVQDCLEKNGLSKSMMQN